MINPNRIKIMTALALYDKDFGRKDKIANENLRRDYVFKKNNSIRMGVFLGFLICLLFYGLHLMFIQEADIITMDWQLFFRKIVLVLAVVMVVYTVICTIKYSKEYNRAAKRYESYFKLMDCLDALESEEGYGEEYGSVASNQAKSNHRL